MTGWAPSVVWTPKSNGSWKKRYRFIEHHETPRQRAVLVAKSIKHWPEHFDIWELDTCYWDWVYALTGADKPVLESLTEVEPGEFSRRGLADIVPSLPAHVMARVEAWLYHRLRFSHEWESVRRGFIRGKDLEEPYRNFRFAKRLPHTRLPWFGLSEDRWGWTPYHCLLWVGGSYARNLDLFDKRQATAEWIYTHMRPLGIQPPEAACKGVVKSLCAGDFHAFAKQWKASPWLGPGPGQ